MLGLGSDEDHVMRFDDLGETFVFGQEAIARMDRVGAGDLGRRDDRGDVEIAVFRRRRPDAHRLVGKRSEEHTSELQSLMRTSYAVFCLKKKKIKHNTRITTNN